MQAEVSQRVGVVVLALFEGAAAAHMVAEITEDFADGGAGDGFAFASPEEAVGDFRVVVPTGADDVMDKGRVKGFENAPDDGSFAVGEVMAFLGAAAKGIEDGTGAAEGIEGVGGRRRVLGGGRIVG